MPFKGLAHLPKTQRFLFEGSAESKSYFLAHLDSNDIKLKSTRAEMRRICERVSNSIIVPEIQNVRPMYNEYQFAKSLQTEIEAYRRDWGETKLSRFNYKIIEALTNWIGNAYSDGYPKRNLYPGQSLSQRLMSVISIELENPESWNPAEPQNADEESRVLNAIRNKVADRVASYCRDVLVGDPRTSLWLPAYKNISGPGTKVKRARTVARILEDRAELPDEGLGKFMKDIWQIIEDTVAEVCALDSPKPL